LLTQLPPTARATTAASRPIAASSPDLRRVGGVLNKFVNLLAYNPEAVGADRRWTPGGAPVLAGLVSHQAVNLFSTQDANGTFRPIMLTATCQALRAVAGEQPALGLGLNSTTLLKRHEGLR
jgi:hypothetical protein